MAAVELVSYKITRLNMVNNIPASGTLQLENAMGIDVKYKQNNRVAVAILDIRIRNKQHPNIFCIELDLQGVFVLDGINDMDSKKEAHVKCYDELFLYANQIIAYLAINSGMQGFMLKKPPIEFADVNFGSRPDGMDCGKVIKLWSDI